MLSKAQGRRRRRPPYGRARPCAHRHASVPGQAMACVTYSLPWCTKRSRGQGIGQATGLRVSQWDEGIRVPLSQRRRHTHAHAGYLREKRCSRTASRGRDPRAAFRPARRAQSHPRKFHGGPRTPRSRVCRRHSPEHRHGNVPLGPLASCGKALPTLRAAALDDRPARPGTHPGAEPMLTVAPAVVWLERTLHLDLMLTKADECYRSRRNPRSATDRGVA